MKIYSYSSRTIPYAIHRNFSVLSTIIEYLTMVLIAIVVVSITTGSHSIGLPLYKINPMHWAIYFAILFRKPTLSSIFVLAFALPLTSNMIIGHPIIIKSIIIGIELTLYGLIFISTIKYFNLTPVSAYIISQFIGHIAYYGLKFVLIKTELMDSLLVSTSIMLQIVVFITLGIAIYISNKKQFGIKFE